MVIGHLIRAAVSGKGTSSEIGHRLGIGRKQKPSRLIIDNAGT